MVASLSLRQIPQVSFFGASLVQNPLLWKPLRQILKLVVFPRIVRSIIELLPNETLSAMTTEQAQEVYPGLAALLDATEWVVAQAKRSRWLLWIPGWRALPAMAEDLRDITEAVAWGAFPEPVMYLREAVGEVESA